MRFRDRLSQAIIVLARADVPGPSDPSIALAIPRRQRGALVSPAEAFSLISVYRAVQIIVTAVTQLSLDSYRSGVMVDPQPAIVRRPNLDEPRSAFLAETVVSLACSGNAYWRKDLGAFGEVVNLTILNPLDVVIHHTPKGYVTGYSEGGRDYTAEEIKHLSLLRVPGTPYGLGPIQAAQAELRGTLDLRDYSSNWFTSSGIPNGVLSTEQPLSQDQADSLKTRWNTAQSPGAGVAVLGSGAKYVPLYLNPSDAQFLESRQFAVTEIARLFGVPSSLMLATVEGSTDTYQNVAQDWLGFVRFSLMTYLIEIEDAFTSLVPRGQDVKFNIEALLRSDTTTRYQAHKTGIEAGFLTIEEVRRIENLPPLATQPVPVKEPANAA